MDVVQEMYSYKYKMYLDYTSKNTDESFAKIAKVLDDILLGVPYCRSKRVKVFNLFQSTRYSGMNIAGIYERIERYSENFVNDKFSTFSFDELEGLEEYLKSWKRYHISAEQLEALLRVWDKGEEIKETIINYNWFASSEVPFVPKERIIKTMLRFWEKNMKNVRKALICSVFKSLRDKDADMKRAETLIKFLLDSIATIESVLGYDKRELYKIIVVDSYAEIIREHYQKESYLAKSMFSCREYIQKCIGILDFETEIAKRYLPESVKAVIDALGNTLIIDHLNVLLPEFKSFVNINNLEGMQKIYGWMKQSPEAMTYLKKELQLHGEAIFCDLRKTGDISKFCETFIAKYREEMNYIAEAFDSAVDVVSALDKGIFGAINMTLNAEEFTKPNANVNSLQVTDLLANYCDKFMKTGTKGLNENLEKKLDDIITIFRYIDDKDIFGKLYANSLSARLIFSLSQSLEAEEMLIKKFKSVSGYTFTKCLEKMILDSELSKELTSKFNNESGLSLSFNALIVQTGSWPIKASASSLLVPQELAKSFQYFNEFYLKTFEGRKLYWHHELSTCDIKLNYLSKNYKIQTSVNVTAVLAIFNNVDSATFEEIRTMTNINAQDLLKYLQFLSDCNILLSNGEIEKSQFGLNPQYENKKVSFKLTPTLKEATQECKETTKSVVEGRKLQLQALIIRIMKAKKTMTHKDLSDDIVEQIMKTFVPSQGIIKEVVEGLIRREYLKRAKDTTDTYNYVA